MAVYWSPGNGPYLPAQGDPGASRRGGVAASPPASLLRPGYPPVSMPPTSIRYVVPTTVGAPSTYTSFVRQPQHTRLPLRPPYPAFITQDGVQLLSSVAGTSQLLAQSAGAAASGLSSIVAPDPAHQIKRPRIDPRGGPTTPLTIDTRESVKESAGYQPQVEAISPTPEDRPAERDDIKSTKDDLLQKISKVDREIAKAESQIAKLKKKQEELEDEANKPSTDSASEDERPNQSIAQNVYSENRRKAAQSHASLNRFSPGNLLPLYNQPSDTEVYNNNKKEYTVFKKKLVEYFKKKNEENETRDRYLTVTYCKLTSVWTRKVDRIENSKKRREREGKSREMYEKLFPELRKQREDKERNERLGTRGTVRSDQELEDVIDRIQEHELEKKKMHSYAVIPPPQLPPEERRRKYTNNNGLVQDPMHVYNERKFVNMWTDAEKETFREKYLQHPKNFFMIAQYLERKSVSDCVQYYYLSKKTENFKQLLRKSRPRGGTRTRRINNPTGEVIAPNVPGVVTRRTVQGLQKEDVEPVKGASSRSTTPQPSAKQDKENEESVGDKDGGKGRKERGGNRDKKAENESSDEEDSDQPVKCGPHPCVVCKATVESSRAVPKERAGQLGLKEDDLSENSRVCETCWCKTLRSKCPLLSCSTSSKGKKLRNLPLKWKELPASTKETLVTELRIPEGSEKVCTTCFGRIIKRIGQLEEGGGDKKPEEVCWTEAQVEMLKAGLRVHGNHWDKFAESFTDKSPEQCKKYFYNMRKKLQLDKIVQEYKKANRPEGSDKPSLSSDEESGSSTSSCEDENQEKSQNPEVKKEVKSSEPTTVPAPEPVKLEEPMRKEDGYDSAATISADETLEQDKNASSRPQAKPFPASAVLTGPPVLQLAGPGAVAPHLMSVNKPLYIRDMLNEVIDKSLRMPSNQRTSEITTIKDLLPDRKVLIGHVDNVTVATAPEPHMVQEDGVLNLTTTKRDRSPPPPHPGPSEHVYRPSYIETTRGPPGFGPTAASRGEKPPEAHGDTKTKTTHKEIMNQDKLTLKRYSEKMAIHSPSHMIHRPDLAHQKAYQPPMLLGKGSMEAGSITRGQPIPQLSQQPSGRGGGFDSAQLKTLPGQQRGSLTSGTPVYTSMRSGPVYAAEPARPSSQQSALDIHKKQAQYSGYPRPASHESRGTSSRSVIENDYNIAKTLPRKDQNEDLRVGFARAIDNRGREVQIVDTRTDPRFDPRPQFYGSPRVANPYSSIRTDPKADIPPREPVRGDPRAELNDSRTDSRVVIDPRGRTGFPPGYLSSIPPMRDPGRRSPPRSLPSSSAGRPHPVPSTVPSPRPGSIFSGMPRSSVEIHTVPRQPEVSITKQPVIPISRPEYNLKLSNLAEIAVQQPKMREAEHRVNPSLTVTRTEPVQRTDPALARLPPDMGKYDRSKYEDRSRAVREQEEQIRNLTSKLGHLSETERFRYLNELGMKTAQMPDHQSKNLIEYIIATQISKESSSPANSVAYPMPGRQTPLTFTESSKESMSKQPSPSVKTEDERLMMMRTSLAGSASLNDGLESMIRKEVQKNQTSPYPGPSSQAEAHEYWKRKPFPADANFMPRPPSQGSLPRPPSGGVAQLSSDERQIIRVAQSSSPRPEKPPSRSMVESISPPNSTEPARSTPNHVYQSVDPMARFLAAQRKPHEVDPAAAKSSGIVFDFVKTKIAEAMRNDKSGDPSKLSMGPPNKRPHETETRGSPAGDSSGGGGGATNDSPRKRYKVDDQSGSNDLPDSPGSGEMVIDESARPDSAHSHKTSSPAPHADPSLYQGYRLGQQLPPRSSPSNPSRPPAPTQTNNLAASRYEPLSDDD